MREVSCRALSGYKQYVISRGADWGEIVSGLRASPKQLQDSTEWIDWEDLTTILQRIEDVCGPSACVEGGRYGVHTELTSPLTRISGAWLSLDHVYRLGMVWLLPLRIRHMQSEVEACESGHLRVRMRLPDVFVESPLFFQGVQGALEALPAILGLPWAEVSLHLEERGAWYDVWLPKHRRGLLNRARALFGGRLFQELERQMQAVREIDRERSRVEDVLRERDRMLSSLLENLSGLVYRCRADDMRFEYASPNGEALTGRGHLDLVQGGRTLLSLVHPEDRRRVREEIHCALAAGTSCTTEYRVVHRGGQVRWVLDVSRGLIEAGRVVAIEGFMTDITAQKLLEEELDQNSRADSIGRLAGGVAHDFNNVLTVVTTLVELSRDELAQDHPVREYNEQIGAAVEQAAGLTRQLLAFARRQAIVPKIVSLDALVRGMRKLLQRTLMEDVTLRYEGGEDLWNVRVDPRQFEQVLLNLAINARHAMPRGGILCIRTENVVLEESIVERPAMPAGRYVLLRVTDTGSGMDAETQLRAFEPFFTTKGVGRGSGLGLASTHGIVRQAGGFIYLRSAPGQGAEFSIYLPRAVGEREDPPVRVPSPAAGRGERILLVEDHQELLDIFARGLRQRGFAVVCSHSGEDALQLLCRGSERIDLLVTDVVMPGLDGATLAKEVRLRFPGLPVLFISGYTGRRKVASEGSASSTYFLEKPFTIAALAGEVRNVIDRVAATRR